jgi:uncharacterized protein YycO
MVGDIILQTSQSQQSRFVQEVTHSPYSHVGIVYLKNDEPYVYEAISTVQMTPMDQWIARGLEQKYTVLRMKNPLNQQQLTQMKSVGEQHHSKKYDVLFQWSDDKMYCSELVWKIYQDGAGIELIPPKSFSEYDASNPTVQSYIQERWGSQYNPNELVVAPSDFILSEHLIVVYSDFD